VRRRQRVAPDAEPAELVGHAAHEAHGAGLARAVGPEAGVGVEAAGGDRDHDVAPAGGLHDPGGVLAAVEDALEHDVDDVVELLGGELVEGEGPGAGLHPAGVGEHDVEPAEPLDGPVDRLGDLRLPRHVDREGDGRPALAADLGHDVGRPLLDHVGHDDAAAGPGPPERALAPEPGTPSGDEDDLVVEAHGVPPEGGLATGGHAGRSGSICQLYRPPGSSQVEHFRPQSGDRLYI
jgi:hypothetical protein